MMKDSEALPLLKVQIFRLIKIWSPYIFRKAPTLPLSFNK
jgi:hypothetical protein